MSSLSKIAKKHLGQNFLIDSRVKDRIIQATDIKPGEVLLEIGPGLGDLTEYLIAAGASVYAIEKDTALISELQKRINDSRLHLISADFLTYDISQLPKIDKIIGNIPYNISTPIIEKVISQRAACRDIFLTVQLEFAKRLTAQINTKDYGALTCFVQYYYAPYIHFQIRPQSFRPIPKVTSSFIQLSFHEPVKKAKNEETLFLITRTAFSQRRKTILNALSSIMPKNNLKEILYELKIEENKRAENITVQDYITLANKIYETSIPASLKTNV
jgi:16S rRNA (adenine1518-N6/adenine1519-N6)-dimethyltransferase